MIPAVMEASQRVEISAPQDGLLMKLHVAEGDWVNASQTLAVLDNRIAVAAARIAKIAANQTADIDRAKLELKQKRNQLARLTRVKGSVSSMELDEATVDVQRAAMELAVAQTRLRQAQAQWEFEKAKVNAHNITAPFAGQVSRIRGKVGESQTQAQPLISLINQSFLNADVHLPVELRPHFEKGVTVELIASKPINRTLQAKVIHVDPTMDAGTHTFRCVVQFDNRKTQLPAGFQIRVRRPTPSLPNTAQFPKPKFARPASSQK